MFGIPHIDIVLLLGCLAIATAAAWSSADINIRTRAIERDLNSLFQEAWERQQAALAAPQWSDRAEPLAPPVFEPLYGHVFEVQPENELQADWETGSLPKLDELASQLSLQSPDLLRHTLSGALDLGAASHRLGTGRQEMRLLRWLYSAPKAG